MVPLSAIDTPRGSPFSTSARVLTRQKTGPVADTEIILIEPIQIVRRMKNVLRIFIVLPRYSAFAGRRPRMQPVAILFRRSSRIASMYIRRKYDRNRASPGQKEEGWAVPRF